MNKNLIGIRPSGALEIIRREGKLMNSSYFFNIDGKPVGPLTEPVIREHIEAGRIARDTLSWCEGMVDWKPFREVSELMEVFAAALPAQPPPLPDAGAVSPPPLPKQESGGAPHAATSDTDSPAYRFVTWMYRSRRGGKSRVCDYVDEDPKRAMPVAVLTVAALLIGLALALSWIPDSMEMDAQQSAPQSQAMAPPAYPPAGGMDAYRAWKDAHDYNQGVIDETFKSNRESFDRQLDSYGDATYDWKHKD